MFTVFVLISIGVGLFAGYLIRKKSRIQRILVTVGAAILAPVLVIGISAIIWDLMDTLDRSHTIGFIVWGPLFSLIGTYFGKRDYRPG